MKSNSPLFCEIFQKEDALFSGKPEYLHLRQYFAISDKSAKSLRLQNKTYSHIG